MWNDAGTPGSEGKPINCSTFWQRHYESIVTAVVVGVCFGSVWLITKV